MKKKLIVFLTCQRSGSSVSAEIFHRHGMSLGTSQFFAATDENPLGYVEAMSVFHIDHTLHRLIYGFQEDGIWYRWAGEIMKNRDVIRPDIAQIPRDLIRQGEDIIRAMLDWDEAACCGVKHPAMCLFWFYWQHIFSRFSDLEIHPVFLLRPPSGIAASYARRSNDPGVEFDMDNVIEVYLRRLLEIYHTWQGPKNIIRFDDRHYANDLKKAIDDCGLTWSEECFSNIFNRDQTTEIVKTVSHGTT